ncbi:hypothetical protein N9Y42_09710 [Mariniblastus sp.]|nr:hypothetical protein [Mariniblastus sp.]
MSQPSSNSSADFNPVQLSLFVGEFDAAGDGQRISVTNGSTTDDPESSNNDLKLLVAESLATADMDSLCPLANEFMQAFEAVSGWEVHFTESTVTSNASLVGNQAPQGKFEIIDMSANWPAKTPTMHRGKCDQLVKLFSDLYSQANTAQGNLHKVQSLLTALTNPTEDDLLVDSFAPTLESPVACEDSDFILCQDTDIDSEFDSAFAVKQEFDSNWLPETSVWSGWSIAGASGIAGESYLDWSQQGDVLTAYVGRLESSFGIGDTESSLEVNAVSRQFKVCRENTLVAFFLWDRRGGKLRSVEPGSSQTLHPGGAIVASTDPAVQMPDSVINAQLGSAPFTAEQLAAAIEAEIGSDQRVLVIKCD